MGCLISCHKGSSIKYVRKIFRKTSISNPLIRTRTCAYQGVRNASFSGNFAYVLNGWSQRLRHISLIFSIFYYSKSFPCDRLSFLKILFPELAFILIFWDSPQIQKTGEYTPYFDSSLQVPPWSLQTLTLRSGIQLDVCLTDVTKAQVFFRILWIPLVLVLGQSKGIRIR